MSTALAPIDTNKIGWQQKALAEPWYNDETCTAIESIDALAAHAKTQLIAARNDAVKLMVFGAARRLISAAITPAVLKELVAVQNTPYGFKTDRPAGYADTVVRECAIHAALRGLKFLGNEWNIIGGNMMPVLNGLQRIVAEIPGISAIDIETIGPPKQWNGAIIVRARATFSLNGQQYTIEKNLHIPARVDQQGNERTGADALWSKIQRRMYAHIINHLQSAAIEIDEPDVQMAPPAPRPQLPAVSPQQNGTPAPTESPALPASVLAAMKRISTAVKNLRSQGIYTDEWYKGTLKAFGAAATKDLKPGMVEQFADLVELKANRKEILDRVRTAIAGHPEIGSAAFGWLMEAGVVGDEDTRALEDVVLTLTDEQLAAFEIEVINAR